MQRQALLLCAMPLNGVRWGTTWQNVNSFWLSLFIPLIIFFGVQAPRMSHSPERQLWCAVITRAIEDAQDRVSAVGDRGEKTRLREEARRWFADIGGDFQAACDAAGYDAEFLRLQILKPRKREVAAEVGNSGAVSSDQTLA